MAGEDRTEKATPKRRQEARKRGEVARSPDLSGALVLIAGVMTIALLGSHIANSCGDFMRALIADGAHPQQAFTAAGMKGLFDAGAMTIAMTVGPIAGACFVAALLGGIAQIGRPYPQAPKFDFKHLSPLTNAKNIFGPNAFFEMGKAITKVAAVGAVAAISLLPDMTGLASKVGIEPLTLGSLSAATALSVAERAGFAYLLIGLVDYGWRRRKHERDLRMTKQEVKDEARQHTVSNEVKQALRRRQMQAAKARMMAAVPTADVIVTNPTHYAVALKYDGSKPAPELVAKGQDLIAAQIRKIAAEHDVPIVADPPLARAIHSSCEIGQTIPAELYLAVARVLAFVYKLAGRKKLAARAA
jgi:flagellar biosynthetic protein FlhB